MKRLFAGLLISPLCAPLIITPAVELLWTQSKAAADIDAASFIGLTVALSAAFGYIATLAVGLPAHIFLSKYNHREITKYIAAWCGLSILLWAVIFIAVFTPDGLGFSLSYLAETVTKRFRIPLMVGIVGALMGATFWAIVRPDRGVDS